MKGNFDPSVNEDTMVYISLVEITGNKIMNARVVKAFGRVALKTPLNPNYGNVSGLLIRTQLVVCILTKERYDISH